MTGMKSFAKSFADGKRALQIQDNVWYNILICVCSRIDSGYMDN